MIIGVNGKIGSGKDTVGKIIQYLTFDWKNNYINETPTFEEFLKHEQDGGYKVGYNMWTPPTWIVKKFAGKLKQVASILTGIPIESFEDQEFKKTEMSEDWAINGMPITVRQFLQYLGTDSIRDNLHPNAWVNALFTDYTEYSRWIITDLRFPNEFSAVQRREGITIRVTRPSEKKDYHISETALDSYVFDEEIVNDGSIDDLIPKVNEILQRRKII